MRGIASRLNDVTPARGQRVDQLAVDQRLQHADQRRARAGSVGTTCSSSARPTSTTMSASASSVAPCRDDPRAGVRVVAVGQRGGDAGAGLDQHLEPSGVSRVTASGVSATRRSIWPCSEGRRSASAPSLLTERPRIATSVACQRTAPAHSVSCPGPTRSRRGLVALDLGHPQLGQRDLVPAVQQPLPDARVDLEAARPARRQRHRLRLEVDRGRGRGARRAARARRPPAAPPAAGRSWCSWCGRCREKLGRTIAS